MPASERQRLDDILLSEVARLPDEIRCLTDAIESLEMVLSHTWQNRERLKELFTINEKPQESSESEPEFAESLSCHSCDIGSPASLAEALRQGWSDIRHDENPLWNFIGCCPSCAKPAETPKQNTKSKPKPTGELF